MAEVNPYQAPQSRIAEPENSDFAGIKIFSLSKRIDRVRFFLYGYGLYLLLVLLNLLFLWFGINFLGLEQINNPATLALGAGTVLACAIIWACLIVQRLHDFNASGWWLVVLIALPVLRVFLANALAWVSWLVFIFILVFFLTLFMPGSEVANRFGKPPLPATRVEKILAYLLLFVLIVSILGVIFPFYIS